MARISDVLRELERLAPQRFAFSCDKVGLQVGSEHAEVERAVVSLDRSLGAIEFAEQSGCQLLVAHHPLIFTPLETLTEASHTSRSVLRLVKSGIGFIAAHTNWDSAQGGVNDVLARILSLRLVKSFGTGAKTLNHKLVFFCPRENADELVGRLSDCGAGVIGAYSRCAFRSEGTGGFYGDATTSPTLGERETAVSVQETRVEMVLPPGTEKSSERCLLKHHPYQTPAYDLYPLREHVEQAAGRIGELEERVRFDEFLRRVDQLLETRAYGWGELSKSIRKVAVVGGAADSEWIAAQRAGADVLVTGEVKQHVAVEASESGLCIVAAGHFATEQPGAAELKTRLQQALPAIEWVLFEPKPGSHGRPWIGP
jgi:dinuclear metal center YbgI/SA1388 family protein